VGDPGVVLRASLSQIEDVLAWGIRMAVLARRAQGQRIQVQAMCDRGAEVAFGPAARPASRAFHTASA